MLTYIDAHQQHIFHYITKSELNHQDMNYIINLLRQELIAGYKDESHKKIKAMLEQKAEKASIP